MSSIPPSFPLLFLPGEEQSRVARVMDTFTAIPFSLCSKRTKELVRLSGQKCRVIEVVLSHRCVIKLDPSRGDNPITLTSSNTGNPNSLAHVRKNLLYDGLAFGRQQNLMEFFMANFTMQSWLKLLLYITNCRIVNVFFVGESYCPSAIKNAFEGMILNMVTISMFTNLPYSLNVMNQLPTTRGLSYSANLEAKDFLKLAIQNFDELKADDQVITLSDLLAVNSVNFITHAEGIKGKDVNRFLKLWTNGSNPRLQRLTLVIDQAWEKRDDCIHELRNEDYIYWCLRLSKKRKSIISGYHAIFSKDGVKATIWVRIYPEGTDFEMYVWS